MKKILALFSMILLLSSCTSCESTNNVDPNKIDLIYNVTAEAKGKVDFSWFNGGANVDGYAKVYQSNDTLVQIKSNLYDNSISLEVAKKSNDSKVVEVANKVSELIKVNGVEGEYELSIKGYVKYGSIVLNIDERYPKK